MAAYGDVDTIKDRVGVGFSDLGLSNQQAFDDLLGRMNERSSSEVDDYCQRDFGDHPDETVKLDGNGRTSIRLPYYPVRSITSVKIGDSVQDADTYRLKRIDGSPGMDAGILERKNAVWPRAWENVEVTFTWGYTAPPRAVREVVEDLVIRTVLESFRNKKTKGASSYGMDGFSVTFGVEFSSSNPTSLDANMKSKLAPHKRMVVG